MALLTCGAASAAAAPTTTSSGYPPKATVEEIRELIGKVPATHPRLLADAPAFAAVMQRLAAEPLLRSLADALLKQADALAEVPPVKHEKQGRRLLDQSRKALKRILLLATAYRLTDEPKYLARARLEMMTAAAFPDWNPSHFLDVGEMTLALAIGYDWLCDALDAESRQAIREAIVRKGVLLPEVTKHNGWVKASNNWGQVCHGGLVAGALAVLEDEPDLAARTVHRAIHNVTRSMAAFAPNGSYPEGPGYWSYGTSFNAVLIAELESALGTDFGLSQAPGFDRTGEYLPLVTGPSGRTFNYADGGDGRGLEPALFWLARRFERPDWLLQDRVLLAEQAKRLPVRDAGGGGSRLLPLLLVWADSLAGTPPVRMPLHWSSGGHVPITLHRSSWSDPNAVFLGLKGGSPRAPHGQMDTGSFVLDADGVRWGLDLGAEGYHGIESRGMQLWSSEQGSDRWTIFRQSNLGHNTLVIDGKLQQAAGTGKIVRFSAAAAFPHSVVDLSSIYAGQAKAVWRGVALLPSGRVLIRDRLEGLAPGSVVRWGMITPGTPAPSEGSVLDLAKDSARLRLEARLPEGTVWQIYETAKPPKEWDSTNPGTVMVGFEVTAPASGVLDIAVLFTPGSRQGAAADPLDLTTAPLAWSR
jgi:hypothetical protein